MYQKLKYIFDFSKLNTTFFENSCKFKQFSQNLTGYKDLGSNFWDF